MNGLGLSLYAVYQLARVTVPTFAAGIVGRLDQADADRYLADFSARVMRGARIDLEVVGAKRVPSDRACVLMSNHQSHIDIPVVYASAPLPRIRMVTKAELFRVPFFGKAMRAAGMVEIDRKNRRQAVDSLRRAGDQIAAGTSVWIAPEGSRSRTGELGPLKKGGFHLASATGTPIVPMAISGTHRVLPPHAKAMRAGVPVRVVFGAPIEVEGRTLPELMAEVADFLAANVDLEMS